jgi:phosphatidylinositol-3-phosphatase
LVARIGVLAALVASALAVASPPAHAATTVPTLDHVFLIVMENHSYGEIIGSSQAPYINSLLSSGALATSYYAVAHPSLPNYVALTSGSTYGITSDCTTCWLGVSHIGDTLEAAGSTWKAYEESMPSACFVGDSYPYAQKHDPFIYYNDVRTNAARCQSHVVPYSQLGVDLQATTTTPNFAFITPNMCDDMHDCSISTGDGWLQGEVPQILNSLAFKTQRSLLAVTWDEDDSSAANQVPLILIGSGVSAGFQTSLVYNHYSLLRTIEAARGVGALTSNDSGAAPIADVFGTVAVVATPCASVMANSTPASPQAPGTTVQLTATAAGCSNPRYEFWSLAPGSQTWTLAQAYGTSAVFAWNTTAKSTGTWRFSVWARDASSSGTAGNVNGTWDAYTAPYYTLRNDPCSSVTWSGTPTGSASPGTPVTIAATASGCGNPLYQFELLTPGSQTWRIVQQYSSSASYSWNTAGQAQGTYRFIVMARDSGSTGTYANAQSSWDSYLNQPYALTASNTTPCGSVTATWSASGSPVVIAATASGCPNPQYQFELLAPGSYTWQVVQPYSSTATFNWNTIGAALGGYRIIVKVRDSSSGGTSGSGNPNGSWDAYTELDLTLS